MALTRPRLSAIEARQPERFSVGPDWNAALGGGPVRGGIVLVASRGGSGKTTEMLRIAARLGTSENPTYYFYSERTEEELAAHAEFVSADRDRIVAIKITAFDEILSYAPTGSHVMLDSYGNLKTRHIDPSYDLDQIRNVVEPATAWIICHVNKRGDLEGREKLSHAASAVVWVRRSSIRTSKNWHGPQITVPRDLPAAFVSSHQKPAARRKLPKLHTAHD